jgi:hypothetical protein
MRAFTSAGTCEDHLEAAVDDVPAHHALGVRIEDGAGGDHLRAALGAGLRAIAAADDHRCRAVAEEPAGDDVRDREVLALEGERAELDREQGGDPVRKPAQYVGGASEPRSSRDAAEAEDRGPLDVGAQAHPVDEARVDRRRRDPGDGDEHQVIDRLRAKLGAVKRASERGLADVHRGGDPGVVALREGGQLRVVGERQREVAAADPHRPVQLLEAIEVEVALSPKRAELGEQGLLIGEVGRQRPSCRQHAWVQVHRIAGSVAAARGAIRSIETDVADRAMSAPLRPATDSRAARVHAP